MARETTTNMLQIYRINPLNPLQINVRENRHNARWKIHSTHNSATEAKIELAKLTKPTK